MIDLDRLDDQLELALAANLQTASERPGPAPPIGPTTEPAVDMSARTHPSTAGSIVERMRAGRLAEADLLIAAHARMADEGGSPLDRRDAAAWATMRALLDGRPDDARTTSAAVLRLGREGNDAHAWSQHLTQRFWLVLDWGDEPECYELLDQCRERAYTYGDVSWLGALTLLLARLGRAAEARRELDATLVEIDALPRDGAWLDIATNLAGAATALADTDRARSVMRLLARVTDQLVVTGPAWVCKGSLARYRAELAATTGDRAGADAAFRTAVDAHRAAGAGPLLVRTLHQWGTCLAGRDDLLSRRCLQESAELAERLGLSGLTAIPGPALSTSA